MNMEELKEWVRELKETAETTSRVAQSNSEAIKELNKLITGNPSNMKHEPGLIVELTAVQEVLRDMRDGQKKFFWFVGLAIVGAILKTVLVGSL